jgi:ABC-type amino acid transport substrate-binding protein
MAVLVPPARADMAEIRARGILRVLAAPDEDPAWFSVKPGGAPGFERAVLEGFARLHKLRFEVVSPRSWEDAIPELVQGKADLLAGVNDTEARRRIIDFTDELLPARNVVVTRRPQPVLRSLEELRAARVAVVPDTTWEESVRASGVPPAHIAAAADVDASVKALRSGRANATVIDVIDYLRQRRKDPELQLGLTLGRALSSAWGVRKADVELRQALDAYLKGLRQSPSWSRLLVEYFGEDAPAVLGRNPGE